MSILKIAQMGEPVLRRPTEEIPLEELGSGRIQRLIDDMIDTMRDAEGAGIAAPQVYESLRLCVIEVRENRRYPDFPSIPLLVLVNPVVVPTSPEREVIAMYEGCLSVTGVRGRVRRPRQVHVEAFDRTGKPLRFDWEGVPAAVVQHETDHLHGTLFVDRADPRSLTFLREYDRYVPAAQRIQDRAAL
jgi:peptide deformylase